MNEVKKCGFCEVACGQPWCSTKKTATTSFLQDLEVLVEELSAKEPKEQVIKALTRKLSLQYDGDRITLLERILKELR